MIKRRLQKRDYWLETDGVDAVALKTLVGRGIIVHDSLFLRYYLAHDVYEEIAIEIELYLSAKGVHLQIGRLFLSGVVH